MRPLSPSRPPVPGLASPARPRPTDRPSAAPVRPRRTRVGLAATALLAVGAAGGGLLSVGGAHGVPAAAAAGTGCTTPAPKARGAGSSAAAVERLARRVGTDRARKPRIASPSSRAPRRLVTDDVVSCRGRAARAGDTVTVRYSLVVWGGRDRVVDTTWGGSGAIALPLQKEALIDGWVEGVPGMRVGGRRVLVVPPGKGYGAAGTAGVPKNSTLIFVIDLDGIA